jgi:hypothetical protein
MSIFPGAREQKVLTEVLKEYLTNLRTEILETDDEKYRKGLEEKEEVLRGVLANLERRTSPVTEKRK